MEETELLLPFLAPLQPTQAVAVVVVTIPAAAQAAQVGEPMAPATIQLRPQEPLILAAVVVAAVDY